MPATNFAFEWDSDSGRDGLHAPCVFSGFAENRSGAVSPAFDPGVFPAGVSSSPPAGKTPGSGA